MNVHMLIALPPIWLPVVLAAHLAAGAGLGVLFFRSLWWNTRIMIGGGRISAAVALLAGRFLGMGALLTLAAMESPWTLLATATGVFFGRFLVLRALRDGEP